MDGYKYVTSRRALEAAFEPLFRAGHLAQLGALDPKVAAQKATQLLSIHLSAHTEHAPMRDAAHRPVKDDDSADDFFG